MREQSHLYPQMPARIQAVLGEIKESVFKQVECTLIKLELDMNYDGADLEGI